MTGILQFFNSQILFLFLSLSLSASLSDVDFCIILRFMELGSILDPGKTPKMDKAVILGDAVRMLTQLRDEAQKLKESKKIMQEKINELKVPFDISVFLLSNTKDTTNFTT
jgi:hypothetical protein